MDKLRLSIPLSCRQSRWRVGGGGLNSDAASCKIFIISKCFHSHRSKQELKKYFSIHWRCKTIGAYTEITDLIFKAFKKWFISWYCPFNSISSTHLYKHNNDKENHAQISKAYLCCYPKKVPCSTGSSTSNVGKLALRHLTGGDSAKVFTTVTTTPRIRSSVLLWQLNLHTTWGREEKGCGGRGPALYKRNYLFKIFTQQALNWGAVYFLCCYSYVSNVVKSWNVKRIC